MYSSISSWVGEEVGFGGLDVLRHGLLRLCSLIGGVLDPGEELVGGDHLNDAATVAWGLELEVSGAWFHLFPKGATFDEATLGLELVKVYEIQAFLQEAERECCAQEMKKEM